MGNDEGQKNHSADRTQSSFDALSFIESDVKRGTDNRIWLTLVSILFIGLGTAGDRFRTSFKWLSSFLADSRGRHFQSLWLSPPHRSHSCKFRHSIFILPLGSQRFRVFGVGTLTCKLPDFHHKFDHERVDDKS